ncbi:hypothetical protein JZ751_020876 [Albula glossodonta]|uniref:Uncharacterized protein n=1 Tax=Albula glossodonta TaxID=121402 RepID=A0A8T2PN61_9TELE|nr:hypothetical protein JZ751_020876 [Albula glossodonta]
MELSGSHRTAEETEQCDFLEPLGGGEFAEHFHEMGGILFIYNLSKSSKHLEVKEAALFTLGGLAENSGA